MKKIRSILIISPALVFILAFAAPAFARDGSDDNTSTGDSSGSSSSSGSGSSSGSSDSTMTEQQKQAAEQQKQAAEKAREALKQQIEKANEAQKKATELAKESLEKKNHSRADDILAELEKDSEKHSDQDKKKNCQAAEKGLEKKLANLQKTAAARQSRIDAILLKALNYQQAKSLNPEGFTDLAAKAQAAKTDAAASVAALQGLSVNLDCNSGNVATAVASFKAAAEQTKTSLQSYKSAVKDIIAALEKASGGSD